MTIICFISITKIRILRSNRDRLFYISCLEYEEPAWQVICFIHIKHAIAFKATKTYIKTIFVLKVLWIMMAWKDIKHNENYFNFC